MEDFQFGDALAVEVFEPRLFFLEVGGEGVVAGRPAVAFAKKADEERAACMNFVEAELKGFFAGALRFGDAPAQIHFDQFDVAFLAKTAQFRPSVGHQAIALRDHVAERRGNKDADAAIGCGKSRPAARQWCMLLWRGFWRHHFVCRCRWIVPSNARRSEHSRLNARRFISFRFGII